jgi:hypothetical protein
LVRLKNQRRYLPQSQMGESGGQAKNVVSAGGRPIGQVQPVDWPFADGALWIGCHGFRLPRSLEISGRA